MYLFDTNILSYWMRGHAGVISRIKTHSPSDLAVSTISLAEILYGIQKSPVKKEERTQKIQRIVSLLDVYSFDENAAPQYAAIRVNLEKRGCVISERDLQIAAIGKANGLTVVTHNTSEFRRVPKLKVEDWYC